MSKSSDSKSSKSNQQPQQEKPTVLVQTTIKASAADHVKRTAIAEDRKLAAMYRKIIHDWDDATKEAPSTRN